MKNELAIKLVAAADKYRKREYQFEDEEEGKMILKVVESDYEDLVSIANMIEANEKPEAVRKAMWKLDTLVREVIPDQVYYNFCK